MSTVDGAAKAVTCWAVTNVSSLSVSSVFKEISVAAVSTRLKIPPIGSVTFATQSLSKNYRSMLPSYKKVSRIYKTKINRF